MSAIFQAIASEINGILRRNLIIVQKCRKIYEV